MGHFSEAGTLLQTVIDGEMELDNKYKLTTEDCLDGYVKPIYSTNILKLDKIMETNAY